MRTFLLSLFSLSLTACGSADVCGNGVLEGALEECDDANFINGDGCDENCTITSCGNGIVSDDEACDDANNADNDGCRADCAGLEICGDGQLDTALGEVCDDGNFNDLDECSLLCQPTACGDGTNQENEDCDDGNTLDGDGCQSDCSLPTCDNDNNLEPGELCLAAQDVALGDPLGIGAPLLVLVGDLNNDNTQDIITIDAIDTFNPIEDDPLAEPPIEDIAIDTFLVVANLNQGGIFTPSAGVTLADRPNDPELDLDLNADALNERPTAGVVADLNGDTFNDVAVTSELGGALRVLFNDGAGALLSPVVFAAGQLPSSLAAADIDADADIDLVVTNRNANEVSILFNEAGDFSEILKLKVGITPLSVAIADVNGDAQLDIISANFNSANASLLINTGDGFSPQELIGVGGAPRVVAARDTDNDGDIDLVFGNVGFPQLSLLENDGDGLFTIASLVFVEDSPSALLLEDIDQDSRVDIVLPLSFGVGILLTQENGTFSDLQAFSFGDGPHTVSSGDLNGDALPDLVIAVDESTSLFLQTP